MTRIRLWSTGSRKSIESAPLWHWVRDHRTAILLGIILFHAVNTLVVVSLDRIPLFGDEALHFSKSGAMYHSIRELDAGKFLSSLGWKYPPLHRLLSLPFFFLLGYHPDVAVWSTLLPTVVLILSMYHIGSELGEEPTGILAAAITVLLPSVFGFSRTYFQEPTLMAATTLTLALMIKSRGFERKGFTFAFGLSIGLGLLVKWTYTLFVLGAILFYLFRSAKKLIRAGARSDEIWKRVRRLLLAVGLGLLLASAWYIPNLGNVYRYILQLRLEDTARVGLGGTLFYQMDGRNPLFVLRYMYQPVIIFTELLGPFFSLVSLASLVYLAIERKGEVWFPLAWFVFPLVVLAATFSNHPIARPVMAYSPAFALIIALGFTALPSRLRGPAILMLLLTGLAQYLIVTYSSAAENPLAGYPSPRDTRGLSTFDRRSWKLIEMTETLNALIGDDPSARVLVLDHLFYTGPVLKYLQFANQLHPVNISEGAGGEPCIFAEDGCPRSVERHLELMRQVNIVVKGDGGRPPGEEYPGKDDYINMVQAWNLTRDEFIPIRSIEFPDGQRVTIYARESLLGGENLTPLSSEGPGDSIRTTKA